MENNPFKYYLAVGIGLLFLIPAAESLGGNFILIATILVGGYWGMLGLYMLIFLLRKIFAGNEIGLFFYNLWLFLSLMCVAVGILAIVDDGITQVPWAAALIFYGTTIGFLNRKAL